MLIESNIRNIGTPTKCRSLSLKVMSRISELLDKDYPVKRSTYRLGDLTMLFPMKSLPNILADCNWALVTENDTGVPLAVFPDVTPEVADKLRRYLCCYADAPMVFYYRPTRAVYVAYMNHDWTIGCWFSLAAHDFIHKDIA